MSFFALQHIKIEAPFFSLTLLHKRRSNLCPVPTKSRTQGLATLSTVSEPLLFDPWDSLSNPYTLGLRSSELFSFTKIGLFFSKKPLRSCAFLPNL
jgi:hypothetical protein